MNGKRAFDLLRKISYERMGGTDYEFDALQTLRAEVDALGVKTEVQAFNVDASDIKECSLEVLEPIYRRYDVTGYKMSGSTTLKGLEGKFLYIEDGLEVNLSQAKGKLVLINNRFDVKAYKRMVDANVLGFITTSGTVYDDINETDLETRMLRSRQYQYGKIPGVVMRIKDAQELVLSNPKKMRLTLVQNEGSAVSHNLIAEIKGSSIPDEVICFTAHYDSVQYSTGAYDNGTGSVTIMELLRYFVANKPKRTVRFIWCGSEEMGLLGSKAYCNEKAEELEKIVFNINLDMTGVVLGKEIAVCSAMEMVVNYIDCMAKEVGFPLNVSQGVYSSDSTPFADKGIPAVSFARISANGGAAIHSRKDVIDFITPEFLETTISFLEQFSERIVNAHTFPFERKIPDNIKSKLDDYLGRNDPKVDIVKEEKKVIIEKKVEPKVVENKDNLIMNAAIYMMNNNVISINKLQSEFYIGNIRATAIIDALKNLGIIGNDENGLCFKVSLDKAVAIIDKYLEE